MRRLICTPGRLNDIYGGYIGDGFESYTPMFTTNPMTCRNHYFDYNWREIRYQRGRVDLDIMLSYLFTAAREYYQDRFDNPIDPQIRKQINQERDDKYYNNNPRQLEIPLYPYWKSLGFISYSPLPELSSSPIDYSLYT